MKYIFVTGMGRSGTSALARILAHSSDAVVDHEGIGSREYWLLSWYLRGSEYAIPFLNRERIVLASRCRGRGMYVDVNGYLQNSVDELITVFDDASVYHLVRDGREVVRSLFSRRSDARVHLIPKDREGVEHWLTLDKFSQVCWNWNDTTARLLDREIPILKLDKVTSDYSYFRENLLDREGLDISEADWSAEVSRKHNRTRSFPIRYLYAKLKGKPYVSTRIPEYEHWTSSQKQIFSEICGETMCRLGYE